MTAGDRPDGAPENAPNAWLWHRMDRDRAATLWVELAEWVQWLRATYQFTQGHFPACWYRHTAVREELTALMAAHKAAYADDAGPGAYRSDMTAWHTHEFWPFMNRLKSIGNFADCTAEQCHYKPRVVVTVPGLEEYIADDLEDRPERAAEASTPPQVVEAADDDVPARDMEAAIAAGLAELVDPQKPYGPARFEDRIWIYDRRAKRYLPQPDAATDPS